MNEKDFLKDLTEEMTLTAVEQRKLQRRERELRVILENLAHAHLPCDCRWHKRLKELLG